MGGRHMQKLIRAYTYSAGSLMLALAVTFILANFQKQPTDFVPAHDLVFSLRLPILFWIMGGILSIVALLCLFGRQTNWQLPLILWLAMNLIFYGIGLNFTGAKGGIKGYLGEMGDVFGVSTNTMAGLLTISMWYLLIGSLIALTMAWLCELMKRANPSIKIACANCGGHIEFFVQNLGQKISCPHCQNSLTLRKPEENLKMSCFFCKEHIEFPAHAIGEKISCPHCKMDITLKELV